MRIFFLLFCFFSQQTCWSQVDTSKLVQSVASLDFRPILDNKKEANWVVVRLNPQKPGRIASSRTVRLDPKTKRIIPLTDYSQPQLNGTYEVVENISQRLSKKRGSFNWDVSLSPRNQFLLRQDIQFSSQATLLCNLNLSKSGRERFGQYWLIPPQWSLYVKPAANFFANNQDMLREAYSEEKLSNLMKSFNPFVSIEAVRQLARKKQLPKDLMDILQDIQGMRKSVLIHISSRAHIAVKNDDWKKASSNDYFYSLIGLRSSGTIFTHNPSSKKPILNFGSALLRTIAPRIQKIKNNSHEARGAKLILKSFKIGPQMN